MSQHWLTRPATIRKLWIGGCVILVLTVLAQLPLHVHEYFGIDGWFGFNAVYGFLACVAMVIFAKALGVLIKRMDHYYEEEGD